MVFGNLCLRENLPFRSANPKTGPSSLSCSRSPSSARRQRALRLNRAYTSDWSWVRTKQSHRPRSARCMLMDTSQRMCGSPIMPCDSVLHLTCAMHFAALPSMRRRKRFQESQQAKQVTFMMPAYDGVKTDRPGFASYGSDIGDMAVVGHSFTRLTIPLALTLALCNMDRIVLSVAMLAIAKEYSFTLTQQVRRSALPVHGIGLQSGQHYGADYLIICRVSYLRHSCGAM